MFTISRPYKIISFAVTLICLLSNLAAAQDLHFSRIQDLAIWYNPSLKSDKNVELRMNYRDVKYEGLIGYRSNAFVLDIPIKTNHLAELDQTGFWNLGIGFAMDQSNEQILKNNQVSASLSYAVPMTGNNLYLAVSLQASYFNSRFDLASASFPDQFNDSGPIANAITNDPMRFGDPLQWYSGHLGLSVFQRAEKQYWSLGLSMRDVTQPLVNRMDGEKYKLKPTLGLQAAYEYLSGNTTYGFYGVVNLKAKAYEQLLSSGIRQNFGNSKAFGLGLAYRLRDAFIPYADLTFSQTTLSVHYEINVSGIRSSGFKKTAIELSIKQSFSKKN